MTTNFNQIMIPPLNLNLKSNSHNEVNQTNQMSSSTSSQTSISNFIAQTPKDHNNLKFNFKNQSRNNRTNTINHPIHLQNTKNTRNNQDKQNNQDHNCQNTPSNNSISLKEFKKFNNNNIQNNNQVNSNFKIAIKEQNYQHNHTDENHSITTSNNHLNNKNNKQNILSQINCFSTQAITRKLPYKMIKSELPANCTNHPDKQSTYFIESQSNQQNNKDIIYYCQKCAILVASQGFYVQKININIFNKENQKNSINSMNNQKINKKITNSDIYIDNIEKENTNFINLQPSTRLSLVKDNNNNKTIAKPKKFINDALKREVKEKQLTTFLNHLQRTQSRVQKNYSAHQAQLQSLNTIYINSQNQITSFFSRLHAILHKYESIYLQQIQQKNIQFREQIQIICDQMEQDIENLQNMKIDICQAYDDVIDFTTNEEFETVMEAYQQNILMVENNLQNYQVRKSGQTFHQMRLKKDFIIDIKAVDIMEEIKRQCDNYVMPIKRQSTKSVTRRMSLMNVPTSKLR